MYALNEKACVSRMDAEYVDIPRGFYMGYTETENLQGFQRFVVSCGSGSQANDLPQETPTKSRERLRLSLPRF